MNLITRYRVQLLRAIDRKYGNLTRCPDTDPMFIELQKSYGVQPSISRYSKERVEELRLEHGWTSSEISIELGYSRSWYNHFRGSLHFNSQHADMFAILFEVDISVLERDYETIGLLYASYIS